MRNKNNFLSKVHLFKKKFHIFIITAYIIEEINNFLWPYYIQFRMKEKFNELINNANKNIRPIML
jgi:hypothetical protein